MMTAIGTAKSTPINPITNDPSIILIKITTGFTPSVLFIRSGIKTLFSSRWMRKITAATIKPPTHPKWIKATTTATNPHNKGPK